MLNRGQTRATLPPEVGRIRADRSEPAQMAAALKGRRFDAVFDISGYRPSEVQPVADALGGAVGHYVFCSSVAVYAVSEVAPILEDSPLNLGTAGDYGRDKVLCEDLLLEMYSRRGLPITVIRPPYIYGPDDPGMRRLFSIFARIKQGRRVIAPANGLTLTHTVHVDDVASAFAAVPGLTEAQGQVYNAAAQEAITFNAYVGLIASIMGVDAQMAHVEMRDYEAMLEELAPIEASEVFDYVWRQGQFYSTEKLRHELGWSPRYDMRDGLEMTYRWWVDQGLDREPLEFPADDRALAWLGSSAKKR